MGQEIGQREEWNHDAGVPLGAAGVSTSTASCRPWCAELNRLYRASPALYQVDFHYAGFEWMDFHDVENSVISFLRRARGSEGFPAVLLQLHAGAAARGTSSACRRRASTKRF